MARGVRMLLMHRDKVGPIMGRLGRAVARASEVVGGTADLVENLQDPDVRRVAFKAVAAHGNIMGSAARPRAAPSGEPRSVPVERGGRRIEVRLSGRAPSPSDFEAEPPARQAMPEQIRRQVTIARVEPVAGSGTGSISASEPEISTGDRVSLPIRRVSRVRASEDETEG
jgi:hypothetical protein